MPAYKGFITQVKYLELMDSLRKIADTRGLENKLHHLHQPDTDMNDKICEDFEYSKNTIVKDLMEKFNNIYSLAIKVSTLKEGK